jgi:hypothetical protein
MENMSFDDLDLLLRVIEIRMVLHILVHGLRFPVLQCDIFTYSMSILIHSFYAYLKCEIALVWLNLFAACGVHQSNYACFLCGLICSPLVECTSQIMLASCASLFVHRLWSAPVKLYLLLVRLDLFAALCHNALVMAHVYSVMLFVSSIDVTFSWLVSTPVLR